VGPLIQQLTPTSHPRSSEARTRNHGNGQGSSDIKAAYVLIGGDSPNSIPLATGIIIQHRSITTTQPPDLESNIQPLRPRRRTNFVTPLLPAPEITSTAEIKPKSLYILSPTSPWLEPYNISTQSGMSYTTISSSSSSNSPSDVTITLEHPPPPYSDSNTPISPHGSSIMSAPETPSVTIAPDVNVVPRRHSVASESHSAWGWVKNHLPGPTGQLIYPYARTGFDLNDL
jgi:hypothetical protein